LWIRSGFKFICLFGEAEPKGAVVPIGWPADDVAVASAKAEGLRAGDATRAASEDTGVILAFKAIK
jgi:hypothetical protein